MKYQIARDGFQARGREARDAAGGSDVEVIADMSYAIQCEVCKSSRGLDGDRAGEGRTMGQVVGVCLCGDGIYGLSIWL